MLDWTWSPYVAAFFAFQKVKLRNLAGRQEKIRIYRFDIREWNRLLQRDKIYPVRPHVSALYPLAFGNLRAIPQQAMMTVTNVDDMESHIQLVEKGAPRKYLEVIDLLKVERPHVMRDLALMGITAGSLFPGLDGACESLREQNFNMSF